MEIIRLDDLSLEQRQELCGVKEENLRVLEKLYACEMVCRDNLEIKDIAVAKLIKLKEHIKLLIELLKNEHLDAQKIIMTYNSLNEASLEENLSSLKEVIFYNAQNKAIRPKTFNQLRLVNTIKKNDVSLILGPAGTGKTYLAIVLAVSMLKNNLVKRIVLTRPAVEAGESLGFLPGDLKEKVDPYLMPLYDALYEMLGIEKTDSLIEKGIIEIIPLAYMRGRTLHDAFIVLDEAQNTTTTQMRMFLTRLGSGAKMVITGDPDQIDLPLKNAQSGLVHAAKILEGIEGIGIVFMQNEDIVRHHLVNIITKRYEDDLRK